MYDAAFGIDVHSKTLQVAYCTSKEVVSQREFVQCDQMMDRLRAHIAERGSRPLVVMEACTGAKAIRNALCDIAEVRLADARAFRERFPKKGQKTDKIDARNLARYGLYDGEMVWVPTAEMCQQRELGKHHISLTQQSSKLKNQIHAILKENGVHLSGPASSLWTLKGRAWLAAQINRLPKLIAFVLEEDLRLLDELEKSLAKIDTMIEKLAAEDEDVKRLMSHPGIGALSGFLIKSSVGDFKRFTSPKQITAYAGIVPSVSQSGSRCSMGRITKIGNPILRWIAVEAGIKARKHCLQLDQLHQRVKKRSGSSAKAKVAVGRKLLERCFIMVSRGENSREGDPELHKRKMDRLNAKSAAAAAPGRRRAKGVSQPLERCQGYATPDALDSAPKAVSGAA